MTGRRLLSLCLLALFFSVSLSAATRVTRVGDPHSSLGPGEFATYEISTFQQALTGVPVLSDGPTGGMPTQPGMPGLPHSSGHPGANVTGRPIIPGQTSGGLPGVGLHQRPNTLGQIGVTGAQTDVQLQRLNQFLAGGNRAIVNRQYKTAIQRFQDALRQCEIVPTTRGTTQLQIRKTLARLYGKTGRYKEQEALLLANVNVFHQNRASYAYKYAEALFELGEFNHNRRLYKRAINCFSSALSNFQGRLRQKNAHHHEAQAYHRLGVTLYAQGDYQKALELFTLARDIWTKRNHPEAFDSAYNLAQTLNALGRYDEAKDILHTILAKDLKTYGGNGARSPVVAEDHNVLGDQYVLLADFEKAEFHHRRSLAIRQPFFRLLPQKAIPGLVHLGRFLRTTGRYSEALSHFERALSLQKKHLGEGHLDVAASHRDLAQLYANIGQFDKAETNYQQALALQQKVLGKRHPVHIATFSCLGALHFEVGKLESASHCYSYAEGIAGGQLGQKHPDRAAILCQLGRIALHGRQMEQAGKLLSEALTIQQAALGKEHPAPAITLGYLAEMHLAAGRLAEAEAAARQALTIQEKTVGPGHQEYGTTQMRLARILAAAGQPQKALAHAIKGVAVRRRVIGSILSFTSTRGKLQSIRLMEKDRNTLLDLVCTHLPGDAKAVEQAALFLAQTKGLSLESLATQGKAVASAGDETLSALHKRWRNLSQQLGRMQLSARSRNTAQKKQMDRLKAEVETIEQNLSRQSAAFARNRARHDLDLAQMQAALPPASLLVDIATVKSTDGTSRYIALVVPARKDPTLHVLGSTAEIDRAVTAFRKTLITSNAQARGLKSIKTGTPASALAAFRKAAETLYTSVIKPVEPHLEGMKQVIFCPDSALNLIPFEVLGPKADRHLIERLSVSYVSAARDVVEWQQDRKTGAEKMILVADPLFDHAREAPATGEAEKPVLSMRSADLADLSFLPLPGTRTEADAIAGLMKLPAEQQWLGDQALEEKLKILHSPAVLHMATHGFFLPPRQAGKTSENLPALEDPLVRSGLALAGANHWRKAPGADDGLLTALEVSGMQLQGTELVVLSACETGVGEVLSGEGVFGLRRAFLQAGAASLISSLWKVPDRETADLMKRFYSHWQLGKGKLTKAQALRAAQLESIRNLRKAAKSTHPYTWGAFILAGDCL